MKKFLILLLFAIGCARRDSSDYWEKRNAERRTLETIRNELNEWDGKANFLSSSFDAWNMPLKSLVIEGPKYNYLFLRSSGPDTIFGTSDDLSLNAKKEIKHD